MERSENQEVRMRIYPVNGIEANNRHWVVRMLRYFGYMWAIGGTIAGAAYGYSLLGLYIAAMLGTSFGVGAVLGVALGGFVGFVGGLVIGLPFWAMALIVDDLHALRIYSSGYFTTDNHYGGQQ